MKEKHDYITVHGTNIKLLIPDTYEPLDRPSLINKAMGTDAKVECAYMANSGNAFNIVWAFALDPQNPQALDNKQERINAIHEELGENQGLIEVKEGISSSGHKYVYSIVKNVGDVSKGSFGASYFLRLLIDDGASIVEVYGSFEEVGMTGTREALASILAEKAGLCHLSSKGMEGWSKDPYDPTYTRGVTKNLAEKEGLDGLFPGNPLSQAREFLLAALENKFVIEKQDNPSNNNEPKSKDYSEKEMLRSLFVDECRRYTYLVEAN